MMNRHRAAVAGAVVLGAVALTGCEKPTPLVTLVSGSDSVAAEERCKKAELADEAGFEACLNKKPTVLKVSEGSVVGVGVDGELADASWRVLYNGKPGPQIKDKTFWNGIQIQYGTFEDAAEVPLQVVKFDKHGDPVALWSFQLRKK